MIKYRIKKTETNAGDISYSCQYSEYNGTKLFRATILTICLFIFWIALYCKGSIFAPMFLPLAVISGTITLVNFIYTDWKNLPGIWNNVDCAEHEIIEHRKSHKAKHDAVHAQKVKKVTYIKDL